MKLSELARRLNADLDSKASDVEIEGVGGIEDAGPGQVTFVANPRYASLAKTTRAAAVLVAVDFPAIATPALRVADPYLAFAQAIELFYQAPVYPPGVHATAVIHGSAVIGKGSHIGAYVVVGEGVEVGQDSVLHPHVVLYPGVRTGARFVAHAHAIVREHCRIGEDVVLQNGVVVGADGFGFVRTPSGWRKILQSGPAVLEDAVEIQANACVDRASVGETRVRRGAKIDNLVQVGHGSTVGEHTLLCAQVGLAGSSVVGSNVVLAGQVGVAGHCVIGDGVIATAQSGIPNDVAPGKTVSGYPAIDNRQWLRSVAVFNRLPEVWKLLRRERD